MNAYDIATIIRDSMGANAMGAAEMNADIAISAVISEIGIDELADSGMDECDFMAEWLIKDFMNYISQRSEFDSFRFEIEMQRDDSAIWLASFIRDEKNA